MTVIAAVTAPVTGFGFVLHDDTHEILANRNYYPFGAEALRRIWTEPDFSRIYIPVNYTALGILASLSRGWHHLDGMAQPLPDVFHAAGVGLHLLNSGLVFGLLRTLTGEKTAAVFPWLSLTGALVFALHPVQVESYARAGNITVTLGGTLSLLCLRMFMACPRELRCAGARYAGATLFFCLALLTRPSMVMLPAAAFFLGWIRQAVPPRVLLFRLLPWVIISAVYTGLTMTFQQPVPGQSLLSVSRMLIAADSLLWYAAQTLWPAVLSVDHGRTPETVLESRGVWLSLLGLAAFLTVLLLTCRRGGRLTAGGGLIFLSLLLPVSGLIPSANRESMSIVYDRHLYLPLAGASMALAAGLAGLRHGWRLKLGIPLVFLLAFFSRLHQRPWAGSVPLFQHVVRMNPESWYGHAQLGTALLFSGHPAEAAEVLSRAVGLNPELADARINLGQSLLETGKTAEAETVLRAAIARGNPQDSAHNNLAVALLRRQAHGEAEAQAREALRLNPSHTMAKVNLSLALSGQGKFEEAIPAARRTVEESPDLPQAWRALAEILFQSGNREEGIGALAHACRLAPGQEEWRGLLESRIRETAPVKPSAAAPAAP